jgi:hypothetical protein
MSPNESTRDFLYYYCSLSKPPQYAVLLTGPWGSGKTWFVKDFLKSHYPDSSDYLYTSLYGVRSYDDIEAEFFRQLHPVLASKGARLFGKLVKGILKTTINIDINDDGKSDGSISAGVPAESFFDSTRPSNEKLLVFDDLERCSIPTADLLGYINQFVEHGGFRVIIAANESEMVHGQGSSEAANQYRRIKEKIIGRTFEIFPELETALGSFISELPSEVGRVTIERNSHIVAQIYGESGYRNLRLLRHALWDFDRLCRELSKAVLDCPQLLVDLLSVFLAYSFEIRGGHLSPKELKELKTGRFAATWLRKGEANPKQKYLDIANKYAGFDLYGDLATDEVWERIFSTGSIPTALLNTSLLNSKYFQDESQPNWVKLWHGVDLSDERFEEVLHEVQREWESRKYKDVGVVIHIAGLFLHFHGVGVLKKAEDDIVDEARDYIDLLRAEGCLTTPSEHHPIGFEGEAYKGLGFSSLDNPKFRVILEYVSSQSEAVLLEQLPKEASNLVALIKSAPDLVMRKLVLSNHADNMYFKTPILQYIDPGEFVAALLDTTPSGRRFVAYAFKDRYAFSEFNKLLLPELPWLSKVVELLRSAIEARTGKISSHSMKTLLEKYFLTALQRLEKEQIASEGEDREAPA